MTECNMERDLAKALTEWLMDPRVQQDLSCCSEVETEEMIRKFLAEYREHVFEFVGEVS